MTNSRQNHRLAAQQLSRRTVLQRSAVGFGSLAMASLLAGSSKATDAVAAGQRALRLPHFPARAKRIIFLFMSGGPSHLPASSNSSANSGKTLTPPSLLKRYTALPQVSWGSCFFGVPGSRYGHDLTGKHRLRSRREGLPAVRTERKGRGLGPC